MDTEQQIESTQRFTKGEYLCQQCNIKVFFNQGPYVCPRCGNNVSDRFTPMFIPEDRVKDELMQKSDLGEGD